ncbi:MAG: hypothetical protein ACK53V_10085, partial [Planctomycetota bacterium]
MSRKPKHRQRAPKVETITKFKRFGFRSYFLLTLALLLASGLIWYASRSPSASSYLNLGDGLESTLETISKSNSNRELKQLSDETFELFPTLALDDKLSAWQVLAAIAVRRQALAKDEPQRLKAVHDELVARQSIVNLSQKSPSQLLQALSRLEQAARDNIAQADPDVARQATSSLILVTSLRYAQRPEGPEPLAEVLSLIGSIEGKFIPDASLIQVLEICLEAFSQQQAPDAAEKIATLLESLFGESNDKELAQWANLVREKQWLRDRQVVEQLSLASSGNQAALTKIKQTAVDLLEHNPSAMGPSLFGVQRALELAQFLENLGQSEDAQEIHQSVESLLVSRVQAGELEKIKARSRTSVKRIGLLGQTVPLPAALKADNSKGAELAVVQFVGNAPPTQQMKSSLTELTRFGALGCRVIVASPELRDEEFVAAYGDLAPAVTLLSQSESQKLAEQCFLPTGPFLLVFDQGKLALCGSPLERVQQWLENAVAQTAGANGNNDRYNFTLLSDGTLSVETFGTNVFTGNINGDTEIGIFNANTGAIVTGAFDDDSGPGLYGALTNVTLTAGNYTLVIGDYDTNFSNTSTL